jgi:hypothetical protein
LSPTTIAFMRLMIPSEGPRPMSQGMDLAIATGVIGLRAPAR